MQWMFRSKSVWVIWLGSVALAGLLAGVVVAGEPALRLVNDEAGRPVAFEASNLVKQDLDRIELATDSSVKSGERLLTVHVAASADIADPPAIVGAYSLVGSTLRFTPRFALRPGLTYRAVLHRSESQDVTANERKSGNAGGTVKIVRDFAIPAIVKSKPAEVVKVYPSAATLPENQLRFYLHFSEPMSRGEAYTHVRLLKADGEPVDLPFLELGEELWDASGKRLTLLIDPGRIKRGVKPREDLGPALEAGKDYTLAVSPGWRDAAGGKSVKEFRKRFRAGPPVSEPINPALWDVRGPQTGTIAPLVIRLPVSLDSALLERTISVTGPDDALVPGRVTIGDQERRWEFQPDRPWAAGAHQLVIDTVLEDLAGNRIGRPFEVDRFDQVEKTAQPEFWKISFVVSDRAATPDRAAGSKAR